MTAQPLVRASIPKSSWAEIERSAPAARDKILRVLGPAFERELGSHLAVSWVPFDIETRIADACYEALGPTGARTFYRDKTAHSFDSAWLKALMTSAMRIFGTSPSSLLKMLPRAWSSLSKDCGRYEFIDEHVARRGISVIKGFPVSLYRRREAWIESLAGGYEAFFVPFRLQGSVAVEDIDGAAGQARFILAW
jgi:hypothetical protein